MGSRTQFRIGTSIAVLGAAFSALCVISLLLAPFVRAHDFSEHLRVNEARRETIRNTSIETASVHDAEQLAQKVPAPNPILRAVPQILPEPVSYTEPAPPVQINRLLMRYKLGNSRAGDPDPLL